MDQTHTRVLNKIFQTFFLFIFFLSFFIFVNKTYAISGDNCIGPDGKKHDTLGSQSCASTAGDPLPHFTTCADSAAFGTKDCIAHHGGGDNGYQCPSGTTVTCLSPSANNAWWSTNYAGSCNTRFPSIYNGAGGCQVNCICCPPGATIQCGPVYETYTVGSYGSEPHLACGKLEEYYGVVPNPNYQSWIPAAENNQCYGQGETCGPKGCHEKYVCITTVASCGRRACSCVLPTTPTPIPLPPTSTPKATPTPTLTPAPTHIPTPTPPLKCEKLTGQIGGIGGVAITSANTSSVKYGDKIVFTATTNNNGQIVKSMTFQVSSIDSAGVSNILTSLDMPANSVNGVWTAQYEYIFNTYGKVRVEVTKITSL